jgi:hypothetical protein
MNHAYRLPVSAVLAAAILATLAGMLMRQYFGVSPAALLRMAFAAAAHFDPRLAACPLVIVGND